jgi:hypothetical protein
MCHGSTRGVGGPALWDIVAILYTFLARPLRSVRGCILSLRFPVRAEDALKFDTVKLAENVAIVGAVFEALIAFPLANLVEVVSRVVELFRESGSE